jgi:hypothetical protein
VPELPLLEVAPPLRRPSSSVSVPSALVVGCLAHWAGVAMGHPRCTVPAGRVHCVQLGCRESAQLPFLFFNVSSLDSNMLQTSKICRDLNSSQKIVK